MTTSRTALTLDVPTSIQNRRLRRGFTATPRNRANVPNRTKLSKVTFPDFAAKIKRDSMRRSAIEIVLSYRGDIPGSQGALRSLCPMLDADTVRPRRPRHIALASPERFTVLGATSPGKPVPNSLASPARRLWTAFAALALVISTAVDIPRLRTLRPARFSSSALPSRRYVEHRGAAVVK